LLQRLAPAVRLAHRLIDAVVLKLPSVLVRVVFAILGISAFSTGLATLAAGRPTFSNYWGGQVLAPAAMLVGALLVAVALSRRTVQPRPHARRGRLRWPTRRKLKSPWADFRKW
jgi:hypothetical protein